MKTTHIRLSPTNCLLAGFTRTARRYIDVISLHKILDGKLDWKCAKTISYFAFCELNNPQTPQLEEIFEQRHEMRARLGEIAACDAHLADLRRGFTDHDGPAFRYLPRASYRLAARGET